VLDPAHPAQFITPKPNIPHAIQRLAFMASPIAVHFSSQAMMVMAGGLQPFSAQASKCVAKNNNFGFKGEPRRVDNARPTIK
jgi:hypothetical protein